MYEDTINEYIAEVTKDMGSKQKEDVGRELRTHILDSADALASERNVKINEDIIREVIAKMGTPEKIAALYPSKETLLEKSGFGKVLKILFSLIMAFAIVTVILTIIAPDVGLPTYITMIVAGSLLLAFGVIAAIFFVIYLYETRVRITYEARLQRLNRKLNDAASPIRIMVCIITTIVWLVIINLFWQVVPFISGFSQDAGMIPLFSEEFARLLPFINLLGIAMMITYLLYLVIPDRWVPSAIETVLTVANALFILWVIRVFPFNQALSTGILLGAKVMLAFIFVMTLYAAARMLWQTIQFILHNKNGKNEAV